MALTSGTRLGSYEITSQLGAAAAVGRRVKASTSVCAPHEGVDVPGACSDEAAGPREREVR